MFFAPQRRASQLLKVLRSWRVLYILTWKCASRRNGVHFSHISTSKSGRNLVCFVHVDFEMCFAPQRREHGVFCTSWLRNVLRATTACTLSTSQLQLDDGWPESVEEQGLLLLVWRHHITNNILKMCYRQSRRGVSRQNSRSARQ